jgi:hypothetical protein
LHIDDDQRHPPGFDGERLGLRRYGPDWQRGLPLVPFTSRHLPQTSKIEAIAECGSTDLNDICCAAT